MKTKIKIIPIFVFMLAFLASCDSDITEYQEGHILEALDQSISLSATLFSFASDATYSTQINLKPGTNDGINKVNLYKVFTDGATGTVSERVLAYSYDIDGTQNSTVIDEEITYDELKEGLSGVPANPEDVTDNSKWEFDMEILNADGSEAFEYVGSNIAISKNPYAGTYEVIASAYFRIDVESGLTDWTGQNRSIGALGPDVFIHPDFWGPSDFGIVTPIGFTADLENPIGTDTFAVSIPKEFEGRSNLVFSGTFMLNCEEDAASFVNVQCENYIVKKADGHHEIHLTYGYYTASGDENEGAREFYEVLRKL